MWAASVRDFTVVYELSGTHLKNLGARIDWRKTEL